MARRRQSVYNKYIYIMLYTPKRVYVCVHVCVHVCVRVCDRMYMTTIYICTQWVCCG